MLSQNSNHQDHVTSTQAARQGYREILEADPYSEEAWLSLGDSLAHERNWNETRATCIKALEAMSSKRAAGYEIAGETMGRLHHWLAQAYSQAGRPEETIFELKLAAHHLPHHVRVHHELGLVCWEERRLEEAAQYLAQALALQYDSVDTLQAFRDVLTQIRTQNARFSQPVREAFDKGMALYRTQHFVEAMSHFRTALKASPDHAEACCYLGLCQIAIQDPTGLGNVERAAAMAPDNADVLQRLAWCYGGIGRREEAINYYLRSIQLQPTLVPAYADLSQLYQQQGYWSQAFEALKRAHFFDQEKTLDSRTLRALCESWVKAEPHNKQAHYELAQRCISTDNWAAAVMELSQALTYGYDETDAYIYLGVALLEMKDWAKSAQSLQAAIARQPDQSLPHALLALVYFTGTKDTQQALVESELALRCLNRQTGLLVSAPYRRLVTRMISKIRHPSRDDGSFWTAARRQLRAEATHGI